MLDRNIALLDTLIALTAQRSLPALEKEFVDAFSRLLPEHVVTLLNVEKNRDEDIKVSLPGRSDVAQDLSALFSIEHKRTINEAMVIQESRSISLTDNAGSRMLVLPSGHRQSHVLLLLGRPLASTEEEVVQILSKIYRNCMTLLNENLRDMLTGLLNRRSFEERVNEINALLRRNDPDIMSTGKGGFAAAVLDIDHFKAVNDRHGHIVGDETLIAFASIMRTTFRSSDLLFRFGGEEFVILLTHTSYTQAGSALNRFRRNIECHSFPQVGRVTVSIGYTWLDGVTFAGNLIEHADQALYYAKAHGRNQVRSYKELVAEGLVLPASATGSIELF